MGGDFDHSDFVDPDFESPRRAAGTATVTATVTAPLTMSNAPGGNRPPSREEINRQVTAAQQALVELKRQQEDLERERSQLEEARRRRLEYEQGREEMLTHLTRGLGLLTEAEQTARRDAEQLSRTLADLQLALDKVSALKEETWTADAYSTELTRALTTLENARMEWNSAQLKWPVLTEPTSGSAGGTANPAAGSGGVSALLSGRTPAELARLGLALTWPVAAAVLLAGLLLASMMARR